MARFLFPLLLGVVGVAVLASLGLWQLDRLAWKEALLSDIEAKIAAAPVALPEAPDPERDAYLAVTLSGDIAGAPIPVFGTWREAGAGYRMVVPFETAGRRVLVDFGVAGGAAPDLPGGPVTVEGNLNWPSEHERTPDADIWTSLDIPAMAARLGTEPLYIVAARVEGVAMPTRLVPTGTEGIPNSHLGYAIQWFGLALVWAGMTGFLLWRIHSRTNTSEA